MSEATDQLLHNPTDAALAAALEQASRRSGFDARGEPHWRPILDEVRDNAEGRSQIEHSRPGDQGARYVSVAWWTDHRGTKHARVCGGDTYEQDWTPHYSRMDHDARPPLWHVFPGRLFRVTRPGREARWVASCACGVTGDPRSLAWMGERCGPCHDRREEGMPHPDVQAPALLQLPFRTIFAVAFSPDSQSIAVSSSYRHIELHILDGRPVERLFGGQDAGESDEFRPLAISPDGRFLAAGDPLEWATRVFDLHSEGANELMSELEGDEECHGLAFSSSGEHLATTWNQGTLSVWQWQDAWVEVHKDLREIAVPAFSPKDDVLAVGRQAGIVEFFDSASWKKTASISTGARGDEDVLFLHYTPDGRHLVLITGGTAPDSGRETHQLRLWNLARRSEEHYAHVPRRIVAVALSPDGSHLAWVVHDLQHSPGEITFWDLGSWQEAGRLEWDPEDSLRDLAFAPDGQALVTGSEVGVIKLWPWRLLLEG
jgi:hypothetical protein